MVTRTFAKLAVIFAAQLLPCAIALAQPAQNEYLADGLNLSDNYSTAPLPFNGQAKDISFEMKGCERSFVFSGIPGGLNYIDPLGQPGVLHTWNAPGVVTEFRVGTKNGAFLAFQDPFSDSFFKISEFNLKHLLNGNLRVYGLYLDFRSNGTSLPYSPQAFFLEGVPLGLGPHPNDPGRTVIYATLEEHELASLDLFLGGFTINQIGSKLQVSLGSDTEPTLPLSVMLFLLGIEDFEMPPVNEVTIGLLLGQEADYSGNGVVDAADYVIWRKSFGLTSGATVFSGDGDSDGDVDGHDFLIWQRGFGGDITQAQAFTCTGWESLVAPALETPSGVGVFPGETILDTGEEQAKRQKPSGTTNDVVETTLDEAGEDNAKLSKKKHRPKNKRKGGRKKSKRAAKSQPDYSL